ncbi:MAG: hypothetical protein DRJ31_05320 [Candidatus Methanomethylicota archaeon]|uniref:Rhodanese domain-containing protein n=1 Tax=Thermoproteota archaeon TaxID=2056631 RepID=A0A497EQZ5_9CREN|nr:MAG: hypothetical protein DRJ31_05320 [Candidatus Verstraetearchaeota archaeon]
MPGRRCLSSLASAKPFLKKEEKNPITNLLAPSIILATIIFLAFGSTLIQIFNNLTHAFSQIVAIGEKSTVSLTYGLLLLTIVAALIFMSIRILQSISLSKFKIVKLADKDTAVLSDGKKYYGFKAFLVTSPSKSSQNSSTSLSSNNINNFLKALQRKGVPITYVALTVPISENYTHQQMINSLLLATWSKDNHEEEAVNKVKLFAEQVEAIAYATLSGLILKRLKGSSLLKISYMPVSILPTSRELFHEIRQVALGLDFGELISFDVPAPSASREAPYDLFSPPKGLDPLGVSIGWYIGGGRTSAVKIPLSDFDKHVVIVGATGSGKSTTAITLSILLRKLGIDVLILDWHGEHRESVLKNGGVVYTPGGSLYPIAINPLDASPSVNINEHIETITNMFTEIFSFTPAQSFMFREALKNAYASSFERPPTISDLVQHIGLMPIRSSWDHETKMALLRRLKILTEGTAGEAMNKQSSIPITHLLSGFVSIELSHINDLTARQILASFILRSLYVIRSKNPPSRLQHVTVIEEAKNLMPSNAQISGQVVIEHLINEMRKFGECIVIVTQSPATISKDIIRNAGIKIIHALRSGEDIRVIRDSLSLTEEQLQILPKLQVGEAIVSYPSSPTPTIVKIRSLKDL